MYRRAAVHALFLGLSLLFATRFFSLARPTQRFSLVIDAGILGLSSLALARMISRWSARSL